MNTLLEYLYYIYQRRVGSEFSIIMLVTLFYICGLVFVSAKTSVAVVNNDINSSGDYGMVKEFAQMKDPADFRFSKFLDIRFDVDQHSTVDSDDMLLSRMDRDSKGVQNHEKFPKNLNHQDRLEADNNKILLQKLDALTYDIQNVTEMLIKINGEMIEIRKNISHLGENQMSIQKYIQNGRLSISKSSNGVTYNGLYPRPEPGRTKDNQTISIPRDCKEVQERGNNVSGVYEIQPKLSPKPILVLCDMETRGGGWTHIQKRFDGSQDFYLGWKEYKFGFGDLDGEFWLGLENIYFMTSAVTELLVELVNIEQETTYAHYGAFKIGPEPDGYPLSILTNYSGDAGDSMIYHMGMKFTTRDYDQDKDTGNNCAEQFFGAWWYKSCHESNLNGKYINLKVSGKYLYTGPDWAYFRRGNTYSLAKTKMLIRQTNG